MRAYLFQPFNSHNISPFQRLDSSTILMSKELKYLEVRQGCGSYVTGDDGYALE